MSHLNHIMPSSISKKLRRLQKQLTIVIESMFLDKVQLIVNLQKEMQEIEVGVIILGLGEQEEAGLVELCHNYINL